MLSEPAIRFEGMAGECFCGCARWVVVSYDELRGTVLPSPNRKVIVEAVIAKMAATIVAMPGGLAGPHRDGRTRDGVVRPASEDPAARPT